MKRLLIPAALLIAVAVGCDWSSPKQKFCDANPNASGCAAYRSDGGPGGGEGGGDRGGGAGGAVTTGGGFGGGQQQIECDAGEQQTCLPDAGDLTNWDAGECRLGVRQCNGSGQWTLCQNYVPPTAEIPLNGKDEDCDGQIDVALNPVAMTVISTLDGGTSHAEIRGVATEPTGAAWAVGMVSGQVLVGGVTYRTASDSQAGFLMHVDVSGKVSSFALLDDDANSGAGAATQTAEAVAYDPVTGRVSVAGNFSSSLKLPGGPSMAGASNTPTGWAATFDNSGLVVNAAQMGPASNSIYGISAASIDSRGGDVFFTGTTGGGMISLKGADGTVRQMANAGMNNAGYLAASYADGGSALVVFGADTNTTPRSLAIDSAGRVHTAGYFLCQGQPWLAQSNFPSLPCTNFFPTGFWLVWDTSPKLVTARSFKGTDETTVSSVATSPLGGAALVVEEKTGNSGPVDLDGGCPAIPAGSYALVSFDSNDVCRWMQPFKMNPILTSPVVSGGAPMVAGGFAAASTFSGFGGSFPPSADLDGFLAQASVDGGATRLLRPQTPAGDLAGNQAFTAISAGATTTWVGMSYDDKTTGTWGTFALPTAAPSTQGALLFRINGTSTSY